MLRNYLKIAIRNLRRQALYSIINVVGLAVALALCVLIVLYVQDEFTFDRFHENADRTYRVLRVQHFSEDQAMDISHPMPLGPALEASFPQVEKSVRLFEWSHFIRVGNEATDAASGNEQDAADDAAVAGDGAPGAGDGRPGASGGGSGASGGGSEASSGGSEASSGGSEASEGVGGASDGAPGGSGGGSGANAGGSGDRMPKASEDVRAASSVASAHDVRNAIEAGVLYADPSFFHVFSFPLVKGSESAALSNLHSVVISEDAARVHFGDEDPIGSILEIRLEEAYVPFTVTGVAENVPPNSTIQFDYVLPFDQLAASFAWISRRVDNWNASSFPTYVLLDDPASLGALMARLPAFRKQHYPDHEEQLRAEGRWDGEGPPVTYELQPLREIHLTPDIPGGQIPSSDPMYSYILIAIALGMLTIACINFTSLAIGRSASRAQEIGIRRVSGAHRRQLFGQFWGEAVLLTLIAVIAGILLAQLFLPTFNTLAAKQASLSMLLTPVGAAALLGIVVVTGLAAGAYPAVVLSNLKPVDVLKKQQTLGGTNVFTRSLLVVQFALSIFLIISTLLMREQLEFIQQANLGFDREHVVVVPTQGLDGRALLDQAEDRLRGHDVIQSIAGMSSSFNRGWSRMGFDYKGREYKSMYYYTVSPNFVDVMDIELVAGRNFDARRTDDREGGTIVNEALVRDFGWSDPIGETLDGFAPEESDDPDPEVIGVAKDFHYRSLHEDIQPMMLTISDIENFRYLLFRLSPGRVSDGIEAIGSTWSALAQDVPFEYSFLDADLERQYQSERRWSDITGYASGFAILIACMGLFGLAALVVSGRRKEIGVRKVLGASTTQVSALLSKRFVVLVLIGFALAVPASYLAVSRWLETFAYRIELPREVEVFVAAGVLAVGVAVVSVGYQSVKAALANPADSLRYE